MCTHCAVLSTGGCDAVIRVNVSHSITLDMSRAGGAGHVMCDVTTDTGLPVTTAIDDERDDDGVIIYRPTVCDCHYVNVYYGGQLIPGGRFQQQVTDTQTHRDQTSDDNRLSNTDREFSTLSFKI